MLLAFLVVFFVLAKFGFPAITGMVEKRKNYIDESLKKAHEASLKLENIKQESEAILQEAREKQAIILKEAAATRDAIVEKAPVHVPVHAGEVAIRQLLGRYGLRTVERLCALCAALHPQNAPACALAAQWARQLEADGVCCRVSQLAVNGRDLMAAGIPAGPALRRVLEALLDGVIRAEYPNEKPALLAAAQKMIAS